MTSPGSPSGGGPAPHPCRSWRMTLTVQTLASRSPTFPEGEGCGWTCPLVFPPDHGHTGSAPFQLGTGRLLPGRSGWFSQPWETVVAVCCGLTQNLGAGSCSLQPPEARLSPRTLRLPPNLHGLASQDPGAPWSPASLLQPPPPAPPPPRGGRALPHLGDTPGSSPDLPKPQSPSPPPPRLEVVFPTERGVRGEVSPAPCDRCSAQSHCLPWCEGRCGQG